MENKILQITGASGWDVAFDDGEGSRRPVACWALVEDQDGSTSIKGMIPASFQEFKFCEEFDEFLCYVPHGFPVKG